MKFSVDTSVAQRFAPIEMGFFGMSRLYNQRKIFDCPKFCFAVIENRPKNSLISIFQKILFLIKARQQ